MNGNAKTLLVLTITCTINRLITPHNLFLEVFSTQGAYRLGVEPVFGTFVMVEVVNVAIKDHNVIFLLELLNAN